MTHMPCVFCEIVVGRSRSSKVYEDADILGFLNIKPVHPGECLLIPKMHVDHFSDIEEALAARIVQVAQRLANRIREVYRPQRVGYVVAGYSVPHAHFLILPQWHTHDITSQHFAIQEGGRIAFTDDHIPVSPREELDRVAELLRLG